MNNKDAKDNFSPTIFVSPKGYFQEVVTEAIEERKIKTFPFVASYLVDLLTHYMITENLFERCKKDGKLKREMLAEMYLKATSNEDGINGELLKQLGDSSLYISGFFGDSLKRKVIDIDYYIGIGGSAYATLASYSSEDILSRVFNEIAERFVEFVDVLTLISQKAMFSGREDLLRLYDRYLLTGSGLAEDKLKQKGLLSVDLDPKKVNQ